MEHAVAKNLGEALFEDRMLHVLVLHEVAEDEKEGLPVHLLHHA